MNFIDFIFPKRCINCRIIGSYLCDSCFSLLSFEVENSCFVCNRKSLDGLTHPLCRGKLKIDGCFASLSYKGVVKKLIYVFKYKPYLADLCDLLSELFYEGIIQNEVFYSIDKKESLIVPIPLNKKRERQRGYNQAFLLARKIASRLNLPFADILKRKRGTKPLSEMTKEERQEEIKNVFSISSSSLDIRGKTIFLVDDIATSGATLSEAAKVLKLNGVKKVYGLVLAHGR